MFTVFFNNFNRSHCECIHESKNEKKKFTAVIDICLIFIQTNYSIKALMYIIVFAGFLLFFLALNTIYKIADNNSNVSYKHSLRILDNISARYVYLPLNYETVINEYKD